MSGSKEVYNATNCKIGSLPSLSHLSRRWKTAKIKYDNLTDEGNDMPFNLQGSLIIFSIIRHPFATL